MIRHSFLRSRMLVAATICHSLFPLHAAYAACASPAREAGAIIYNSDFKTMQFCDGTDWWNMKSGGLPSCSDGDTLAYSSATGWGCAVGGGGGDVPSGTVAAFDLASCPAGWTAYAAGVGRVIVGVGTYAANADDDGSNASFNYTLGLTGGRRDHALSIAEMPSHSHTISTIYSTQNSTGIHAANSTGTANSGSTDATGGGGAHENRQPYVALLYCKKD